MKGKSLGLLALTLLLSNNDSLSTINSVEAHRLEHRLSEAGMAWNSLHSHSHSHSHNKNHKKKHHAKKHKHEE